MPHASLDPTFDPAAKTCEFTAGEDRDLVVVGNADRADRCEAQIKMARWGMGPLAWTFDQASATPVFADGKLTLPGTEQSVRIYRDTPESVEFELVLHQRPTSARFQFGVEGYADLRFLPQLALTPKEISDGVVRPDDTVDSIVVYHASRAGNQYRAGRWGHFKRAWARDADGNHEWGSTTFSGGTLTVEFDAFWMANAKLPITIGPNLGVTGEGGTFYNTDARFLVQNRNVTAGSDGTASKLWVYTKTDSDRVKLGLYAATGGGTLLSSTYELASPVPTSQWNSVDCSGDTITITSSSSYHVAIMFEAAGHGYAFDAGGDSGDLHYDTSPTAYASQMVDPGEDGSNTPLIFSAYMEYTEAGVGTANPFTLGAVNLFRGKI